MRQTLSKGILGALHDEVPDGEDPVKDTHDLHVVEDDGELVGLGRGPVVELQLKHLGPLAPGAGLKDLLKHIRTDIYRGIWKGKAFMNYW